MSKCQDAIFQATMAEWYSGCGITMGVGSIPALARFLPIFMPRASCRVISGQVRSKRPRPKMAGGWIPWTASSERAMGVTADTTHRSGHRFAIVSDVRKVRVLTRKVYSVPAWLFGSHNILTVRRLCVNGVANFG